jgi:hypothetical protein
MESDMKRVQDEKLHKSTLYLSVIILMLSKIRCSHSGGYEGSIFWDITLYIPSKVDRIFGGTVSVFRVEE